MRVFIKTLLTTLFVLSAAMAAEESELTVSNSNNQFALNLYKSLSKQPGDVFFSPVSLHALLAIVYQGAADSTKDALSTSLQFPDPATAAEGYHHVMSNLNDVENVTLHIANKVYLKDNRKLRPEFETVVKDKFLSDVELVNFEESAAAAGKINTWVNDKTKGKITDLFSPDAFDGDTRLVLVNAIYFKGTWADKFHKEATRTEPFYVDGEENKIDCQMMHRTGGFNYKRDEKLKAQVLEMPFTNNGISLLIVLPNEKTGIADLEKNVEEHGINQIWDGLHWNSDVIVSVPKFKLETKMEDTLKKALSEIGVGVLFDDENCKLPGILDNDEPLVVSKVVQKAYIEVNEEGAEAAAASGVVVATYSARIDNEIFQANHPFLFVIKNNNNALFVGKIVHPKSGDDNVAPRAEPTPTRYPNTDFSRIPSSIYPSRRVEDRFYDPAQGFHGTVNPTKTRYEPRYPVDMGYGPRYSGRGESSYPMGSQFRINYPTEDRFQGRYPSYDEYEPPQSRAQGRYEDQYPPHYY